MTPSDRAMLVFATKWAPYGGGDEYILPEFGVCPVEFYQRILVMITTTGTEEVDFATKQFLRQFCIFKISRSGTRNSNAESTGSQRAESEATDVLPTSTNISQLRNTHRARSSSS